MTTEQRYCPHCGQRIRERWESISKGLVTNLRKLAEEVSKKKENKVHLQKELNLTKNEYNNFQKLRYFGLAVKVKGEAGYWLLTARGIRFLKGEININRKVLVKDNLVVGHSEEVVSVSDVFRGTPYWLKREDYQ